MPRQHKTTLPLSARPLPATPAWIWEESFLIEAGSGSHRTESTYRSGLRLFADWLQHFGKAGYDLEMVWPLTPTHLNTAIVLEFRTWLTANRARATVTTYMAAITGYLNYLDGIEALPAEVRLGKLQRQLARRRIDRNQAEAVIDLDTPRQHMPRIVTYYAELALPSGDDRYSRRLSLLRDRAVVNTLYSTGARISEIVALNRRSLDDGRAHTALVIGKGNKARTLYLQEYARTAIQAYLRERRDNNPALFVAHSRNARAARLSITSVHNIVKRAVRALDLHADLSAHDFRHFRATQLLREGMPIEVVQEFLGHADISTTRNIYAPVLGTEVVSEWLNNFDIAPAEAGRRPPPDEATTPAATSE